MGYLGIYDIIGIQSYIFNTSKLKEIIGASVLVENALKELLIASIKEVIKEEECRVTDWSYREDFVLPKNNKVLAEVIYIGGGNAIVAYRNKDIMKEINKNFSKKLFENTYSLKFAFAQIETDFKNFTDDYKRLNIEKEKFKYSSNKTRAGLNYSITMQDIDTGMPIIGKYNSEYLTMEKKLKRDEELKSRIKKQQNMDSDFIIPDEFEYMISEKYQNSYIAIVHIDGNNMGKRIEEIISKKEDYSEAVKYIRIISSSIEEIYQKAFNDMVKSIEDKLSDNDFLKKNGIKLTEVDGKKYHVIRDIILNGDDVTYVINGKLALDSAAIFISNIESNSFPLTDKPMSCCAGVALMHSHYTFSNAYGIAEQCCSLAKRKAKVEALLHQKDVKSYIDFHICSGAITSLENYRKDNYMFPGKEPEERGTGSLRYYSYSFLERPWLVTGESNELDWECFKKMYVDLLYKNDNNKPWPRSRLKELQSKFHLGQEEVKEYLFECKSRGYILPGVDIESTDYDRKLAAYYDVIELMDHFALIEEV